MTGGQFEEYGKHDVAVYGGYLLDKGKLLESASGGIATAMAEKMIEMGGYVAGVSYSSDYRFAEYILINKKTQLSLLKGSKYIEVKKNSIFADVKQLVQNGKSVLFIGLPCMVASLYKFLGFRPENLLTCELVCHGPTSAKVHEEYIDYLEKMYNSKIVSFSVRHKKRELHPILLYAIFQNGKIFQKPFYDTEYGYAFSVLGRESCYTCLFKGNHREGDIMIGDFWGANKQDIFWNKMGTSVVFAETTKGDNFIKSISTITLFPTTFEKAVAYNLMVIMSKSKNESKELFETLFEEKGLIHACSNTMSRKYKIKKFIKRIIPNSLSLFIKKAYLNYKQCLKT